jgi:DNA invertase Pin-like site-specific DNA recombinase
MKQTVVIYTRVSTEKQTTDSQLASLRGYCARHDWQDVQVITDTISGSKISRKGLDQLMKAVRAGKVDVVLCYNLDRLWPQSFTISLSQRSKDTRSPAVGLLHPELLAASTLVRR